MRVLKMAEVDYHIAQKFVFVNRQMPSCIDDMKNYYIARPDYSARITRYYSLLEANDLIFCIFFRQWLDIPLWLKSAEERFEFITELYSEGCVHGAYIQIWSFNDEENETGRHQKEGA